MKVNRILLAVLGNRGIPVPRPNGPFNPKPTIDAHVNASNPGCQLRSVWDESENALDIRTLTLATEEGKARLTCRRDDMAADETRYVITIMNDSAYPATVTMALAGQAFDDVVRHPDINGLGLRIEGARRLAVGGLMIRVMHDEGMLVEAS